MSLGRPTAPGSRPRSVNQLIVRERDRDRLLQGACDNLIETRGCDDAWIALLDEVGGLVTNVTFVVDKRPPFRYTNDRKAVVLFMENWVLPEINLSLCNQCGACVEQCPTDAVEMGAEGPFIARPSDCTYCALCDALCPQGAITCTYEIVWEAET